MRVKQNEDIVIINFKNGSHYVFHNILYKMEISDNDIISDHLFDIYNSEYEEDNISLDIIKSKPVLDQLQVIIPSIIREQNYVYSYNFVNEKYQVIAYGNGVSREVESRLREEIQYSIDHIDKVKNPYILGIMLYFSAYFHKSKFIIHPMFIYYLYKMNSKNIIDDNNSIIYLLERFKPAEYPIYYEKYLHYKNNPDELTKLDIQLV